MTNRKPKSGKAKDADVDRVAEIERLAALNPIEYEAARVEAAMRLTVRASILDREVTKKRRALGLETGQADGQGRAMKIVDPLPWHEPVAGDMIATALSAAMKTYAVLSAAAADTIALWILHTWLVNSFMISPRLAITSPTKGCGKTTVLRLLAKLVRRPKRAGSISPPALFRAVEQFQPTILLDETEKYIEHGSDLHALLNEGHCKGGTVLRVLGEKLELREFSVFGAVAFARNGWLPDDLEQRSIIVEMQRRRADETLAELRDDRCEPLQRIARMCARWAEDNASVVVECEPDMGALINRGADNWRPLYAIADLIGADWPQRLREAATVLTPRASESTGPMLLADIKAVFEAKKTDRDRIWSEDLCEALVAMEGRPWAEWKAHKRANPKPVTKNQLARLLEPFHVAPDSVWIDDRTKKGYLLSQFREAFERYLSPEGADETEVRKDLSGASTSYDSRNGSDESAFRFLHSENVNNDAGSSAPPFRIGGNGGNDASEGSCARVCQHCGSLERSDKPVESFEVGDETYLLHPECYDEWLASPDPADDWSFHTEDDSAPANGTACRLRIIGEAPGAACIRCHAAGSAEKPVFKIRDAAVLGSKPETLHEGCAAAWFRHE